jgi:hypothetical protein
LHWVPPKGGKNANHERIEDIVYGV